MFKFSIINIFTNYLLRFIIYLKLIYGVYTHKIFTFFNKIYKSNVVIPFSIRKRNITRIKETSLIEKKINSYPNDVKGTIFWNSSLLEDKDELSIDRVMGEPVLYRFDCESRTLKAETIVSIEKELMTLINNTFFKTFNIYGGPINSVYTYNYISKNTFIQEISNNRIIITTEASFPEQINPNELKYETTYPNLFSTGIFDMQNTTTNEVSFSSSDHHVNSKSHNYSFKWPSEQLSQLSGKSKNLKLLYNDYEDNKNNKVWNVFYQGKEFINNNNLHEVWEDDYFILSILGNSSLDVIYQGFNIDYPCLQSYSELNSKMVFIDKSKIDRKSDRVDMFILNLPEIKGIHSLVKPFNVNKQEYEIYILQNYPSDKGSYELFNEYSINLEGKRLNKEMFGEVSTSCCSYNSGLIKLKVKHNNGKFNIIDRKEWDDHKSFSSLIIHSYDVNKRVDEKTIEEFILLSAGNDPNLKLQNKIYNKKDETTTNNNISFPALVSVDWTKGPSKTYVFPHKITPQTCIYVKGEKKTYVYVPVNNWINELKDELWIFDFHKLDAGPVSILILPKKTGWNGMNHGFYTPNTFTGYVFDKINKQPLKNIIHLDKLPINMSVKLQNIYNKI
jgi:hypothetical protein